MITDTQEKNILEVNEWVKRFEHDLETTAANVTKLAESIAKIGATVETLAEAQRGLLGRQNRPVQWGAIIGGFTMLGVMAGLLIAPIQVHLNALQAYDINDMKHRIDDSREVGILEERTKWLMLMEDRLNRRLHSVTEN